MLFLGGVGFLFVFCCLGVFVCFCLVGVLNVVGDFLFVCFSFKLSSKIFQIWDRKQIFLRSF